MRALRARNSSKSTPLHWAVVNSQLGAAKLLVEAANKLAASSASSETGNDGLIDEPDSDLDENDEECDDAAADGVDQEASRRAIGRIRGGGSLVLMKDGAGRTPLGEAELNGWDEGARFLVSVMELGAEKAVESVAEHEDAVPAADESIGDSGASANAGADADVRELEERIGNTKV